jgi:hypothetical protein
MINGQEVVVGRWSSLFTDTSNFKVRRRGEKQKPQKKIGVDAETSGLRPAGSFNFARNCVTSPRVTTIPS